MYVTNVPYKFVFQGAQAVVFLLKTRLNFPVGHMYPDCVEAAEQSRMTVSTVVNPHPANTRSQA